ncbi:MAG: hypothetical protein ACTHL8_01005 [Burkholderiaceae bacterium]
MSAKRDKPIKRGLLSRAGIVTGWSGDVFVYSDLAYGEPRRRTLGGIDIEGSLSTPVRGVSSFKLWLCHSTEPSLGSAEDPAIGAWTSIKGGLQGAIHLTESEYHTVLTMLTFGKLGSINLTFQEPRYGRALISMVSFHSGPPQG